MANVLLCFPNRCDEAVLVSGSNTAGWSSGLPLSNLQVRQPGVVARGVGTAPGFNAQLPVARTIRGLAIVNHNLSLSGTYRLKLTNEAGATNLVLQSEDFSQAVWTKTSMSVGSGSVGPGAGMTVKRLTASAGNGRVIQDLGTIASAAKTFSVWLKRITGTGDVQLTLDNGTSWSTVAVTSSWARYQIAATLANPDVGIRLVTSGDAVDATAAQLEDGVSTATSYYPSGATAGVRPQGHIDHWQGYLLDTGLITPWPSGYTVDDITGSQQSLIHILSSETSVTGVRFDFSDSTNPAGYVQMGRLFMGAGFQPATNMAFRLSHQYESGTSISVTPAGTEYFDEKPARRVSRFFLPRLTASEAMTKVFEMQRKLGISGEVLFVYDPGDAVHFLRRSFVGRLSELSAIEMPYANAHSAAMEIRELI